MERVEREVYWESVITTFEPQSPTRVMVEVTENADQLAQLGLGVTHRLWRYTANAICF